MVTPDPKELKCQQEPPGNRFKKLAKRSHVCKALFVHTHVLQIIDDHQLMWFEATSDAERRQIRARLRRQIALACVNVAGFELFVHGAVLTMADPLNGAALILFGLALLHAVGRGQ